MDAETTSRAAAARRWGLLAAVAAAAVYLLIVLGGWVRITGSGMGCGTHWPLCHGQLIPLMDLETFIEWSHRLFAGIVSLLIAALAIHAWWPGRGEGWRGRRRDAGLAVLLLTIQVLLGAVTVRLELPPASVVLHLGTAMLLLAVLLAAATRELTGLRRQEHDRSAGIAWGIAVLGFGVVLLGALVANYHAAPACQGFPLCNGQLFPSGGLRIHLHWTHRLVAYALALLALGLPRFVRGRRPGDAAAARTAWLAPGLAALQVAVGAAMVLGGLPEGLRALHVALGAALFGTLVVLAELVRRPPQPAVGGP